MIAPFMQPQNSANGPNPVMLDYASQPQEQDSWCWAAVAASVSAFYTAGSGLTQCAVATQLIGALAQVNCCSTPLPCICNNGAKLSDALKVTENYVTDASGSMTFADIETEIDAKRPIGCCISWGDSSDKNHFVAIYGYDSATQDLYVGDPQYPGIQTVPINVLLAGYLNLGSWTWSYRTGPPPAGESPTS